MGLFLGWVSNEKYGVIGGVRAIVQSLSFEIRLIFLGLSLVLVNFTFSVTLFMVLKKEVVVIFF